MLEHKLDNPVDDLANSRGEGAEIRCCGDGMGSRCGGEIPGCRDLKTNVLPYCDTYLMIRGRAT